ncbi:PrgI family mobile element protein [Streptococcus ovis]|uniref:PrgI family mobile element protein n=1 Tax=Streptococcus ovis TaxID=82806 RepID=UPI000380A1B0|nr:PrgI family protein [Streptococcus ovis]
MKLGSKFLKEFENYEKPIFGNMTKQNLILLSAVIGTGVLNIVLLRLGVPQIILFILSIPIIVPALIFSSNRKDEYLERWKFKYTIQDRAYLTDFGKEEKVTKNDFIQSKTVSEAKPD